MQKKQLRNLAIIALVAIFVVGTIMRLNIEPADLGKGDNPGGTQVVEQLPTEAGNTEGNGDDVQGNADDTTDVDSSVDGKDEENSNGVSGDGDVTAVSDGKNTDGKDTDGKNNENEQTKQPATVNKDNVDNSGDANSGTTVEEEKPASSAETGSKPGAWPPIPAQSVADPDNPQTYHCTMEIYCTTLLNEENIDNEAIIPYIPEDGVILAKTTVEFTEGENAFDLLLKACRANDIHYDFREDALYSGAYIEGINYIYEFDGGPLSGWMYKVNGQFPNYGCKRYIVQDGDAIVWMYTCDLGRDVGDNSVW